MRLWFWARRVAALAALTVMACATPVAPPAEAPSSAQAAAAAQPPADIRLDRTVEPTAYTLALTIDPRQDRFAGVATIDLKVNRPTPSFWLHAAKLSVSAVRLQAGGREIGARLEESAARPGWALVTPAEPLADGPAQLQVTYDAAFRRDQAGLYLSEVGGERYVSSQMQPIDARTVFPSFDEPSFKTPFTVSITAPAGMAVVTNGPETAATPVANGMVRRDFARTEPLPTYLLAFVVGPYDVVEAPALPPTALRPRAVPLRGVAPKGRGAELARALATTRPLVEWFEDYFATPYPYAKLDIIAVPDHLGGMENAAAIIYDDRLILLGDNPPISQLRFFADVHAHEIAHQWFGNYVTPGWWDDAWLNEGFAVWISYKAAHAVMPELGLDRETQVAALGAMGLDSLRAARRIREPVTTEAGIAQAFDAITYDKGGGVIAMIDSYLGPTRFRDGVRAHMRRFPHGVATSDDFFASLAEGAGDASLIPAFESFTTQNHVPLVAGAVSCPARGPAQIALSQRTYAPLGSNLPARTWTIPLCVNAYPAGGAPTRACTLMAAPTQTITLPASAGCPRAVALNADGAGYFRTSYDAAGWAALPGQLARLSAAEQAAVLDSAEAAFATGGIDPAALLSLVEAGAQSTDPHVLRFAVGVARGLQAQTPPPAAPAYQAWVRRTFEPVAARLGAQPGADGPARVLRQRLTSLLADPGRSPALRAQLLAAVRDDLGMTIARAPAGPPADLRALALGIAVEDGGPELFARLLARARASQDSQFRSEALAALGRTPRAEDRATYVAAITSEAFPGLELGDALFALSSRPDTAAFAAATTKAHLDELLRRGPVFVTGYMPYLFAGPCEPAAQAELDAFFAQNGARLPGHERSLAQVREAFDQCLAIRAAQGEKLSAALTARR